jgi:hypothetical protein
LMCAVTVGLLGIVAAALPLTSPQEKGSENGKKKRLTPHARAVILVGSLISAITLVMNLAFAADHREYSKSIVRARQTIGELNKNIAAFQQNPDVKAFSRFEKMDTSGQPLSESDRKEMARLYNLVVDIEKKMFGDPVKQLEDIESKLISSNLSFGPTIAYAAFVDTITVAAAAESNDAWQAEQNSYALALQKMSARLVQYSSLKLTPRDRDTLPRYVEQYAKRQSSPEKAVKGVRIRTQLSMPSSYSSPALMNAFLRAELSKSSQNQTLEQQIQTIRASRANPATRNSDVDGFLESSRTNISLNGGMVRLQAKNPGDGQFVFRFGVPSKSNGAAQVRLEALEIYEDSSNGSTRWTFHVLSEGRVIMTLPEQRWDSSKHPTICWWDADAGFVGDASIVSGSVPLTIVGIKPKVTSAKY